MGWKRLIRKLVNEKEPERKLQDPEKGQKKSVKADPLERIAALKTADLDLTILLKRASGSAAGAVSKQWHITEVDPLTFYEEVSETLGGGAYRMTFRKPDATLYRLDGSDSPETHTFTVAGKPKLTGESTKEKSKGVDFWQEMMKEGSVGMMILKGFFEQRGKPDEVLMELLKTAISGNGNKADPTALLANVTDTVVKLKEAAGDSGGVDPMQYISQFMTMMNQYNAANKPPVATTGSNSSGLDKFFESLGAAAPAFAPLIANALAGSPEKEIGEPTALPATHDNVISMPHQDGQPPESKQAFAGTGAAPNDGAPDPSPDAVSAFDPMSAFRAPDLAGGDELSPQSAAFGAIMKLRYMIKQQADPLDIASEMVDAINLTQGAKRVEGVWENYIDDPGEAFDQFAPLIPEWLEHPEYRTECREAMIKAVTDYFDTTEEQPIDGATKIEIDDVAHDTKSPGEHQPETPTDDTVERTGDHARSDDHGIIDG